MYQEQRLQKILDLLAERGQLSSKETIDLLGVSRDTVRRDFALLTEQGQVIRTHGGLLPLQEKLPLPSFNDRLSTLSEEKEAIVEKALPFLVEDSLCFFDVSTIVVRLAQLVDKKMTIYSHALDNALMLVQNEKVTFHLLGGKFYPKNRFYYAIDEAERLRKISFDIALIGASGLKDGQITFEDEADTYVKCLALKQAKVKILVAEMAKFEKNSRYILGHLNEFDYLITDKKPSQEILAGLKDDLKIIC